MPKNIELGKLNVMLDVIKMLKKLSLLEAVDYMILWEKRPKLTFSKLGDFEFDNPEELYSCLVTFWHKDGSIISRTRFITGVAVAVFLSILVLYSNFSILKSALK